MLCIDLICVFLIVVEFNACMTQVNNIQSLNDEAHVSRWDYALIQRHTSLIHTHAPVTSRKFTRWGELVFSRNSVLCVYQQSLKLKVRQEEISFPSVQSLMFDRDVFAWFPCNWVQNVDFLPTSTDQVWLQIACMKWTNQPLGHIHAYVHTCIYP